MHRSCPCKINLALMQVYFLKSPEVRHYEQA